jgi:putative transcriptional regulator
MTKAILGKQRRFESKDLDIPSTRNYDAVAIKAIREQLQISQATLAMILNTSLSTVQQWEHGVNSPAGSSARLLQILERKGVEAFQ